MRRAFLFPLWVGAFLFALITATFLNDHFDRITRARQLLTYGEVPFRDFQDPGYFLTLYLSAAAQWLTGGGLLGELILTSAALATASVLAFALARSISGSQVAGLLAFALTCLFPARAYDWDKVLFYMAGLALIWHYVERPSTLRLTALAGVTALAAMCRYDNGVYLLAATVPAMIRTPAAVLPWGAALAGSLLPAALFIESTAGLREAIRQIVTYASVEGERSELLMLPQLGANPASIIWLSIVASLAAGAARLVIVYRSQPKDTVFIKIVSTLVLLLCVSLFVLRNPIEARVGAAVPLAAVLVAYVLPWRAIRLPRTMAITAGALIVVTLMFAAGPRLLRIPGAVVRRATALTAAAGPQGPTSVYFPGRGTLAGLAAYLNRCTGPRDRILLTWYAPELYFFAQRGFGAGMPVMLGTHWSSPSDQRQAIEHLQHQSVPIIVMSGMEGVDLDGDFPLLAEYVRREYRDGGTSTFGDSRLRNGNVYTVLVQRSSPTAVDAEWRVACPARTPLS